MSKGPFSRRVAADISLNDENDIAETCFFSVNRVKAIRYNSVMGVGSRISKHQRYF